MTVSAPAEPADFSGAQRPTFCHLPPATSATVGRDAVELARIAGLALDPWQAFVLESSLALRGEAWAAFEVALLVSRQNGKGAILEARELAGLFLLGEKLIIHSAHEFKTAAEAFRRVLFLIQNTPDLWREVKGKGGVRTSHGEEGIELRSGQRLRFVARSGGSGRGFTADCVILDEAFRLGDGAMSALMPTLSAIRNPQLWYTSSAGNQYMKGHEPVVLGRLVRRGREGADPSLAYFDWCARDGDKPDDPATWARANPGLGIRISVEHVARECRSMSEGVFATERLGLGDYPTDEDEQSGIPLARWAVLADPGAPDPQTLRPVVFSFDVAHDRSRAAIGVAGRRPDGMSQVEVADHANGTAWVVPRLDELKARYNPAAIVLDTGSPAASLLPELQQAGIEPALLGTPDIKQACGGFYDAVMGETPTLRHPGTAALSNALQGASRRDLGDAWAWSRKHSTSDICPLVAVTNALHGLSVYGSKSYDLLQSFW